jgi:hypothetical protein
MMNEFRDGEPQEMEDIDPSEPLGKLAVTFDVPIPTIEQVAGCIARQVMDSAGYRFRDEMQKIVREKLDEIVIVELGARVRPMVSALLDKPLQPTNGFGEPIGEPTSLQGLLAKQVEMWADEPVDEKGHAAKNDTWNRDKAMPRMSRLIAEVVRSNLAGHVDTEVKRIAAELKKAATDGVAKRIAETVAGMVLK